MPSPNGLDLYHGDDRELIPDFVALKAAGFEFLFHKVSQGITYIDPKCEDRVKAARDAGLKIGGYHFLAGSGSALAQAQYFHDAAYKAGIGQDKTDQFALDYETNKNYSPPVFMALGFLQALYTAGAYPWIYGSDLVRAIPAQYYNQFVFFKLWLAEYGPHENIPKPWTDPAKTIWQFSGSGSIKGVSGHVDLNYCPGDLTALWTNQEGS